MTPPHAEPWDDSLFELIDAVSAERFGAGDLRGAALGRAVQTVSEAYLRQRGSPADLHADRSALCARLKFFLPRDLPKVQLPLRELATLAALPQRPALRVLDLGAGLGATSLGCAAFMFARPGIERICIDLLDRDGEALAIAERLCRGWSTARGVDLQLATRRTSLTRSALADLLPPYDLILLGFVLNELGEHQDDLVQHHHEWLLRLSELLSPDGAMIVLEPALRRTSRALQEVRGLVASAAGPPYVFAPCLHQGACPLLLRARDWCHQQLPLTFPPRLAAIAHSAGLRATEPSFSYLTLLRAPRSLGELDRSVPPYRIVSAPLASKGKREWLICGGGGAERLRRLDRHAGPADQALDQVRRGSILRLSSNRDGHRVLDVGPEGVVEILGRY